MSATHSTHLVRPDRAKPFHLLTKRKATGGTAKLKGAEDLTVVGTRLDFVSQQDVTILPRLVPCDGIVLDNSTGLTSTTSAATEDACNCEDITTPTTTTTKPAVEFGAFEHDQQNSIAWSNNNPVRVAVRCRLRRQALEARLSATLTWHRATIIALTAPCSLKLTRYPLADELENLVIMTHRTQGRQLSSSTGTPEKGHVHTGGT